MKVPGHCAAPTEVTPAHAAVPTRAGSDAVVVRPSDPLSHTCSNDSLSNSVQHVLCHQWEWTCVNPKDSRDTHGGGGARVQQLQTHTAMGGACELLPYPRRGPRARRRVSSATAYFYNVCFSVGCGGSADSRRGLGTCTKLAQSCPPICLVSVKSLVRQRGREVPSLEREGALALGPDWQVPLESCWQLQVL